MNRQCIRLPAAALALLLLSLSGTILAAPQEGPRTTPQPPAGAEKKRQIEAEIDKQVDGYDLAPHPLPPVPDNPPPHEGAMIGYPHTIGPTDLLLVEVLEALPGRPISGERLVRTDGTISLGFYGDVHVAGLNCEQAKVKIIRQLRKYLNDEVLGLIELLPPEQDEKASQPEEKGRRERLPPPPKADEKPSRPGADRRQRNDDDQPRTLPLSHGSRGVRRAKGIRSLPAVLRQSKRIERVARNRDQDEKKTEEQRQPVKVPLEAGGQITITIEVQAKEKEKVEEAGGGFHQGRPISAEDSDRVFVDVTAYNSKNYFVLGDVGAPGRLPFVGNETVLDALQFAGGLLHTAEPKDIRLVRPARGGKPARVYKVDLVAIRDRGDVTSNFQIFPGDRLVVGRNEVVKKTIEVDRLASAMQTIINSILQESFALRSIHTLNPENYDANIRSLVEFWIQEMKRPGAQLDENTIREALIRRLNLKPEKATDKK
jgi:protein involved in polysaccharide export with SLBB domain